MLKTPPSAAVYTCTDSPALVCILDHDLVLSLFGKDMRPGRRLMFKTKAEAEAKFKTKTKAETEAEAEALARVGLNG